MGRPGTAMAAYGTARGGPLEEREISALVTFLRSKGPPNQALPGASSNGDSKRGAVVFDKNCKTCHGEAGKRGSAPTLQNPELLNAATPAFLQYAIVNGRHPRPCRRFRAS